MICLFGLSSKAQTFTLTKSVADPRQFYQPLLLGQASRFDSAVAISWPVYRRESQKLKFGSRLIDSLSLLARSQQREIELGDSIAISLKAENKALSTNLKESQATIKSIFANAQQSSQIAIDCEKNRPKRWGQDPKTWGLAGLALVGVLDIIFKR